MAKKRASIKGGRWRDSARRGYTGLGREKIIPLIALGRSSAKERAISLIFEV